MGIQILVNHDWRRKHDPEGFIIRSPAERIVCFDSAADLIQFVAAQAPGSRFKATGSHWGLSEAALSDHDFIETNWPHDDDVPRHTGLDVDLGELISDSFFEFLVRNPPVPAPKAKVDPCLSDTVGGVFLVHVKAGTRIYELYRLLDQLEPTPGSLAESLNHKLVEDREGHNYSGPWAMATLGGSGGQTVFGALTTGTHGGDYRQPPIADSAVALHLITDGGRHYWIERSFRRFDGAVTDDAKLQAHYANLGGQPFEIIRNDAMFDAVVVAAGRFGIVASVVLEVVPQYCLQEHRILSVWENVRANLLSDKQHHSFDGVFDAPPSEIQNRFLQIAVNIVPKNGGNHSCGVTQRWFIEQVSNNGMVPGRQERGTIETAGKTYPYEPNEMNPHKGDASGTFLQKACADGNFVKGVIRQVAAWIDEIITEGGVALNGAVIAVFGPGVGQVINDIGDAICDVLRHLVEVLEQIADELDLLPDLSLAQVVEALTKPLLADPILAPLALMAIRLIFNEIFDSMQKDREMAAISYAVMDTHDYKDRSCYGNAASTEVFFDARQPAIYCSYVDALLAFQAMQEEADGRITMGYLSLRFIQQSRGLISPARFPETVAIEVAGIRATSGSEALVEKAVELARHPQFNAAFHWGQENPLNATEVQRIFNAEPRPGALDSWRTALRQLTQNGQLAGFSSAFTHNAGLEP